MKPPPVNAFIHTGTESVVVIITEPVTERQIEVLTDPRPRQQVGISLAQQWARRNKKTLIFS